jgi:hypothetical protein
VARGQTRKSLAFFLLRQTISLPETSRARWNRANNDFRNNDWLMSLKLVDEVWKEFDPQARPAEVRLN